MTRILWVVAGMVALCLSGGRAWAQMLLENSMETRFQIDLKVPAAALAAYFPVGFTTSVATEGPAKDCNLRVVFIDRITINDPEGKTRGQGFKPPGDSGGAGQRSHGQHGAVGDRWVDGRP